MTPESTPPASDGAGTSTLQRAKRRAARIVSKRARRTDLVVLLESHETVLAELRATQESLVQTQRSLLATQQSLSETQHSLADTQRALTRANEVIADLNAWRFTVSEQVRGLQLATDTLPILADGLRSCLSSPRLQPVAEVTVVLTTCDRHELLDRALSSLVRQQRQPAQVVVVNDGSTPVDEVLQKFGSLLPRVDLVNTQEPHSGAASARNQGLDEAVSSLITYLDDDNEMAPGWLAAIVDYFEVNPDVNAVYGGQLRADEAAPAGVLFVRIDEHQLLRQNSLDTGVIAHRATPTRWNAALRRLNDWDFACSLAVAETLHPLPRLASIYNAGTEPRISARGSFRLYRDSVRHRHGSGPGPDEGVCCLCDFRGPFGPGPAGQPMASCPNCRALPRHRLLALLLPAITPSLMSAGLNTALEVAPFESSAVLFRHNGMHLLSLDADPEADGRTVDLVGDLLRLPIAEASLPLLLVSHVLEHVEDDRQAISEIARVLLPSGVAVVQVPLRTDGLPTEEDPTADEAERIERFGQRDHVRLYGLDILDRFSQAGLTVHTVAASTLCPRPLWLDYRLNPEEPYFLLHRNEDCGLSCWIQEALTVAESAANQLDVYLTS